MSNSNQFNPNINNGANTGISIQQRNTQHGSAGSQASQFHHDGPGSTFKTAQRESARLPGVGSGIVPGQTLKKKQSQEALAHGQHATDAPGMTQSSGAQPSISSRKVTQKQIHANQAMSPQKKGPGIGNERAPGASAATGKDMSLQNADGPVRAGAGSTANAEASLFNKHYNKELKLCEDEIPMVLCELNESAMAYLGRDQFDNALLLLQKAHGVLDVVDLSGSRRDQFIAFQLFHNMAMCYQKQGQLEECALCLETTLDHLGTEYATERGQTLAVRIFKLKLEVRLRLQFCAILSQLHRHKEALEQALEGIKIAHLVVRDKIAVCRFFSKRIDFQELYGNADDNRVRGDTTSRERESQSRSEATASKPTSANKGRGNDKNKLSARKKANDDQSKSSFPFEEDLQAGQFQFGARLPDEISNCSVNDYQTEQAVVNNLDGSISLVEKTSKKLLPIYKALLYKISTIENKRDQLKKNKDLDDKSKIVINDFESSDDSKNNHEEEDNSSYLKGKRSPSRSKSQPKGSKKHAGQKRPGQNVDLRHILGFLNQTEWIQNLNIGNIMQIGPLKLDELTVIRNNDECLSRESFLEVISFLIVGYFCASTEIRFIIQLKDEIGKFQNFSIDQKSSESELWHTMSLDIACSFLPSDCPLLNHILLSYQKHHAPSQSNIPENSSLDEKLRVIKPHSGIDNSKFQPIIRTLGSVKIDLPSSKITPAQKKVTKLLKGIQSKHIYAHEKSLALSKQVQGGNSNTPVAQQAPRNNQQSPKKQFTNQQALKLLKLEKIVGKFAKEVGYDKKQILKFLLGDQAQDPLGDRRKSDGTMDGRFQLASHSGQTSQRPQSHKESLGSRQNLDSVNANTGMAAKLAYNNLRKYGDQDAIQQNLVANTSQTSIKSAASQNWRLSPQSFVDQRNGRSLPQNPDSQFEQERLSSAGTQEPASQAVPIRVQGQKQGEKRYYESESSHRDNSFLNDFSQVQVTHHDKSFNEQLDDRTKFGLNQSDMNMEVQHHSFSIGATAQAHGGTVRQNSKRVHSHERGKVQRPRSSKGYRGAQQANQSQTQVHSHVNSNGTSHLNSQNQHQMSAHHLHTAGLNSIQNSSSLNVSSNQAQKFHTTKSEERALKSSQQNQRSLVAKGGQRQKTANASHNTSSHQFQKDPTHTNPTMPSSKKLASLGSQLQSQSSTQLPSAQVTGSLQKLTKKQIQQMQQHAQQQQSVTSGSLAQHPSTLASAASSSQLASAAVNNNLVQYNSLNSAGAKNSKMKMNYDDLKKFLIKEQNSAQVQQLLQQHAALGSLTSVNSQSQLSFASVQNQSTHIDSAGIIQNQEGGNRGRSQPGSKSKKMAAQSQSQLAAIQALQNQQKLGNIHGAQSLEKLEQIQVSLDEGINTSINYQSTNNRDIKDLMYNNSEIIKVDAQQPGQPHNNQSKKAKQIIAQARKATGATVAHQGHIHQNNGQFQQVPNLLTSGQSHQSSQQAQQLYLNSLATNSQRPNSSNKYGPGNPPRPSHNQMVPHREVNSKSALATVGKHQSVNMTPSQNQVAQNQSQAQGTGNAAIKRREKGRLIMQEWLTKSGQNVSSQGQLQVVNQSQIPGQHVQLLAAQAASLVSHNSSTQLQQHSAPNSKNKFVQKQQLGAVNFDLNSQQISLTKQQQQQLHQLQLQKQNAGSHGLDRSISQQNNINVKMQNE